MIVLDTHVVSELMRGDDGWHRLHGSGAAIALGCGAAIATRNVRDFAGLGLTALNPWES